MLLIHTVVWYSSTNRLSLSLSLSLSPPVVVFRHPPLCRYIMAFPGSTTSKMRGWAAAQTTSGADAGMMQEQLACGCMGGIDVHFEHGCGRRMSDGSSMWLTYLLELYKWQNDTALVHELWPHAKQAAQWQLNVSKAQGVPYKLETTYDILGLTRYVRTTEKRHTIVCECA